DSIKRHDDADWSGDPRDIRLSSVLRLARGCNWDEGHSRQVTRLPLDLFDQTLSLHGLAPADRELLEHASLLHDIGEHVATESHHKHTAYLIQHGRLRGFSPDEVTEVATLARYHRGGDPRPSSDGMAGVVASRRGTLARLAALLRVADGLDRGRAGAVGRIETTLDITRVRLHVRSDDDVEIDLWGGRRKRELFERLFDRRLELVRG
ncbi:MAG: HD domain-containing protein, partial [Actinomycetota bacterium]|nr:HD domain-containing protein [Actinomycetota bacterium]